MTEKETEKGKTKKELETELAEANETLEKLSVGYQNAVNQVNQLGMLANRYEETINLLTARLLEGRAQP